MIVSGNGWLGLSAAKWLLLITKNSRSPEHWNLKTAHRNFGVQMCHLCGSVLCQLRVLRQECLLGNCAICRSVACVWCGNVKSVPLWTCSFYFYCCNIPTANGHCCKSLALRGRLLFEGNWHKRNIFSVHNCSPES